MKRIRLNGILLVSLIVMFAVTAAARSKKDDVNEIGDRDVSHRSIISQEKEIALGRQYATEIERTAKIVKDPVIAEYVNRVAQNLARNSDLKIPLTVKVIDSPELNAFALPGGFLYVNTGLIQAAEGEDQLAGVMAHEIAHVAARHWASQMTKATLLQYATIPLIFIPMTYPVYMGVSTAMNFGIPLAFLKFSRGAEAEADYLGLQYMYKSGYDPNAYVTFFGKIVEEERRHPGSAPKIFMDHPPTQDRILKSEQAIKEILPQKEQYLVTTSEFEEIKDRLRVVVAKAKKQDKSAPTLRKREPSETASTQAGDDGRSDQDDRPVLRRRN
jgi:predicted Zn-dependent protease